MIKTTNDKFITKKNNNFIITPSILNTYCKYDAIYFNNLEDNSGIIYTNKDNTNKDNMVDEVKEWMLNNQEPSFLIVNKYYDAIKYETEIRFLTKILPLFKNQTKHTLVVHTQSDDVMCEPLYVESEPNKNVILVYNVTCSAVAYELEPQSPNPFQRLSAAITWQSRGYRVIVNINPLIPVVNFNDEYEKICSIILDHKLSLVNLGVLKVTRLDKDEDMHNVFKYETEECADGYLRMANGIRLGLYKWFIDKFFSSDIRLTVDENMIDLEEDKNEDESESDKGDEGNENEE